jgi:hypothetical protein
MKDWNAPAAEGFQMTGCSVVLDCDGTREVMIVSPLGCESDSDIETKAFLAARNGYPKGMIGVKEIRPNSKWQVYGRQADEAGECFWQI